MSTDQFVYGVDYGTDSVRSIIVEAHNGRELASSVFMYPRWQQGLYWRCRTNQFRQHPLDLCGGTGISIKDCIKKVGGASVAQGIRAIPLPPPAQRPSPLMSRRTAGVVPD